MFSDSSESKLSQLVKSKIPNGPAAVEFHVTMDLLDEAVTKVTLIPDSASERLQLPSAQSLRGSPMLVDRGFFEEPALTVLDQTGAAYAIHRSTSINPKVFGAYDTEGECVRGMPGNTPKQRSLLQRTVYRVQLATDRPQSSHHLGISK